MQYNNKKQLKFLKNSLMVSGIILLLALAVLIYIQQFGLVIVLSSVLLTALILNRILNFNYVRIQMDSNRIQIRYYSLFSADRNYEAIDFPSASLRKVTVKKYLLGLKWDLHLSVQLKQGLAHYPPVCLSAIPFKTREKIMAELLALVP